MAMETKILEVKNSEEASTIKFWTQFGWQLKSSQRIYNKDSHVERRGDSLYNVTETIDFTKLVFERDKSNPNYSIIVKLEEEYLSKLSALPQKRPSVGAEHSSMESWAKSTKPDVRNLLQVLICTALWVIGLVIFIGFFVVDAIKGTNMVENMGPLPIVPFIAGIIISTIFKVIFKKSMLRKALNNESADAVADLKRQYEYYQKQHSLKLDSAKKYDDTVERLNEIEAELEKLI